MTSTAFVGASVIDGTGAAARPDSAIVVDGGRITWIGPASELIQTGADETIDVTGKFAIPGLMNANVHLFGDIRLENMGRQWGRFEDLITEAAQVALKSGMTTVFDTWGPRRFLMAVRDQINAGELVGSRIFCAGNIIGFDGPISPDFLPAAMQVASDSFANRLNAIWAENTGRHLMWLTPEQLATEIRTYIGKGIDFIKYGSNEHFGTSAGAFLAFSESAQRAIVDEAHLAGLTAQAHVMSCEGLRVAIEAGCDLITHCNITGPVPMPQSTIDLFVEHNTGAVIFPWTEKGFAWIKDHVSDLEWTFWSASDTNARNLINSGASLMLANDGSILAPEGRSDPFFVQSWGGAPDDESLMNLPTGHFMWFRAMEEKGCEPMRILQAATRNIAEAYGVAEELGTLEVGKIADMVILDKNPLDAAKHYSDIALVVKAGAIVDRDALPENPVLTGAMPPPEPEEAFLVPAVRTARFPMCPMCMWH